MFTEMFASSFDVYFLLFFKNFSSDDLFFSISKLQKHVH